LLRGQLLLLSGDSVEALDILTDLQSTYPDEPEVKLNLADARLRLGRWRQAREAYLAVRARQPSAETDERLESSMIREQTSRFAYAAERKVVRGGHAESIAQWSGHQLFGNYLRVGFNAETNDSTFQTLKARSWQTELYGQQDFENGMALKGSLFAFSNGPGWGVQITRPDSRGRVSVQAQYRRPFWEFGGAFSDGAVRDRIEVRREQHLGGRLVARFGMARNRYGTPDQPGASSTAFDGALTRTVELADDGTLALEYGVDAEYRNNSVHSSSLPVVNREIHALSLAGESTWSDVKTSGFLGYSIDRLGGRGSFFGWQTAYERGRFEAGAGFERRLNSIATGEVVSRYSAHINWRF
jgi:hypothetical protein